MQKHTFHRTAIIAKCELIAFDGIYDITFEKI